jgi:hypothetical protein
MKVIRFAQFGMGPIGVESVKLALDKGWLECLGAVDVDPKKIGKTVADLTGDSRSGAARVYASFDELCDHAKPDVVLHTAGSKANLSIEQITPIVRRGVNVASTCEELLFPQLRAADAAAKLDALCRQSGARIVGTGVNPGFVMDVLPVCITGVSRSVRSIRVERVVDASTRREPLQRKIGSGMAPEAFRRLFAEGKAGHAGFRESIALLGHCMGWPFDDVSETCEPVVAQRMIRTKFLEVSPGQSCGLHQRCIGKIRGETKIELDLKMYLGADDPHDAIRIEGEPPLDVLLRGGVAGDQATVAALINVIPRLLEAAPGLKLMTDLSVPAWTPPSESK